MANEDFVIEDGVLKKYNGKDKNVVIPNGVTTIGERAFYLVGNPFTDSDLDSVFHNMSLASIISITIPDSVTSIIGNHIFDCCYNLEIIIVDENNLYFSSLDGVLYSKDKSTLIRYPAGKADDKFTIPDSVTSIGQSAFEGCENLTSIVFPNSVTRIGYYAFEGCENLKKIKAPKGWDLSKACVPKGCKIIRY